MRDDFDSVVADRFKVLDDVPVPDTWSRVLERVAVRDSRLRVPFSDEALTMIDLDTPVSTEPRRQGTRRVGVAALLAAASVIAIVVMVTHDDAQHPADQPAPTVTVPPTTPPQSLSATPEGEQLVPGTYFVDEVDGTPTQRIFVSIGAGWVDEPARADALADSPMLGKHGRRGIGAEDDVGFITFSRPDRVYSDACHLDLGFHPGAVRTLDGLVAALSEQDGWVDVTAPSEISVDGYPGKTFQRTAPAVLADCRNFEPGRMRLSELGGDGLKSWLNEDDSNFGGNYYEPGQFETLLVVDIDGTVVVISANLWAGSSAADRAEFAAVLDSIRIDRG